MAYKPTPLKDKDGKQKARTADDETIQVLYQLLLEQRLTNRYLSIVTGEDLTEEDLES